MPGAVLPGPTMVENSAESLATSGRAENDRPTPAGTHIVRPNPAGIPPTPLAAVATERPTEGRSSPDYLHAPNEEFTAVPPTVPPVLGGYTDEETSAPDRSR